MKQLVENALAYAQTHNNEFLYDYFDLLKIKSISTDSTHKSEITKAANWLKDYLLKIGVPTAHVIETNGNPLIFGEWL